VTYELPPVISLHKYFIWCNAMRLHFEAGFPKMKAEHDWHDRESIDAVMYMSYWYAGLFVVIEGWRELDLQDANVNVLLTSPNVELLKRYRNGVFHYQKKYFDRRILDFVEDGIDPVHWVRSLHSALSAFFLDWCKTHNADGNLIGT
jgi:hypothetical protein